MAAEGPGLTAMQTSEATLRAANPADTAAIHALVLELARYEKLEHEVQSTPAMLGQALFGEAPRVFCEVAEVDGTLAGLALWFYDFSTFRGRHGIYLEDLFVRPAFRGRGLGRRLVGRLAARCVAEDLSRLSWAVLDWNRPAIDFYRSLGAELLDEWTGCRLSGEALRRLGSVPA